LSIGFGSDTDISIRAKPVVGQKGNGNMFDQIDHEALGKKTLKEKVIEGAIILAVVGVMIGIMLYALEMA
jgi:hypothetical protein